MNSSINQLREALALLVNDSKGSGNGLDEAAQATREISNSFSGVNSSLYDGWRTASDFFNRIQEGVKELCEDLYKDIDNFVEETSALELTAQKAVEKANETARKILEELELNKYPTGGFKFIPISDTMTFNN